MRIVHFVTHPEVSIDPAVRVPDWPLSPVGLQRMRRAVSMPRLSGVRSVFSSSERKARDTAAMLADHLQLSPIVIEGLGENDRFATGYLPTAEFEAVANAFFAHPQESVRGWERAVDAQRRIVAAVDRAVAMVASDSDIAIISHGGVGALLLCHLKGVPISRSGDQPGNGGGNVYSFDAETRRLLSGWRRIEEYGATDDETWP